MQMRYRRCIVEDCDISLSRSYKFNLATYGPKVANKFVKLEWMPPDGRN